MHTPENYFTIISVINDAYIFFYFVFNSIANLILQNFKYLVVTLNLKSITIY